jgi:23S rRNA (adenine2503-C2)-methyltransferase
MPDMPEEDQKTPTPPTAPSFLDLTVEQVRHVLTEAGEPAYRADQLADWVYAKGVTDPAKMTNLPATLKERFTFLSSQAAAKSESRDGTVKLLLKLADGETIESVLIPTARFASACLSTQVGCAMGCAFCASGRGGFKRNLSSGEILEQVLHLQQAASRHVTHVIFMGMGEPLANYDATVAAVRALGPGGPPPLQHLRAANHGIDGRPARQHPPSRAGRPADHARRFAPRPQRRPAEPPHPARRAGAHRRDHLGRPGVLREPPARGDAGVHPPGG